MGIIYAMYLCDTPQSNAEVECKEHGHKYFSVFPDDGKFVTKSRNYSLRSSKLQSEIIAKTIMLLTTHELNR